MPQAKQIDVELENSSFVAKVGSERFVTLAGEIVGGPASMKDKKVRILFHPEDVKKLKLIVGWLEETLAKEKAIDNFVANPAGAKT